MSWFKYIYVRSHCNRKRFTWFKRRFKIILEISMKKYFWRNFFYLHVPGCLSHQVTTGRVVGCCSERIDVFLVKFLSRLMHNFINLKKMPLCNTIWTVWILAYFMYKIHIAKNHPTREQTICKIPTFKKLILTAALRPVQIFPPTAAIKRTF